MLPLPETIPLEAIRAARARIFDSAIRTPLIRLPGSAAPEIWLKLEVLQPVGSFKIRGARNAIGILADAELSAGVYTASAGNMALGLAWCARERQLPCSVIVPDSAPRAKLSKLEQLGARVVPVSYERWWRVLREHEYPGMPGRFIHPVADVGVVAGNGTIGLELFEELPQADAVLVPFGGGGLSCGIASALAGLGSGARVIGCEVETATPLSAALAAGAPRVIERTPSFVDGIGGAGVLPEMWPLIQRMLTGAAVVSLQETRAAIRTLVERSHIVAEGAGAVPVAAALAGRVPGELVVCVVSGGNIDPGVIVEILSER
ncbi:MAG TPA: pyridoxal-phosphate dependent enzyme [Gemmatimonadales bacterium]|jgi:threonine dehydratase|nr:pyridoxal-phosphate dependent enzyme [Gemmatimonadales bacterium]